MRPVLKDLSDVEFLLRHYRRWPLDERVIVFRDARKKLMVLRKKGEITREQYYRYNPKVLRMLKGFEMDLERKTGETVPEFEPRSSTSKKNGRVEATRHARALAVKRNIDLSLVKGTGENGKIYKKDVEAYAA